jgi:hypothetical protein
MARVDMETLSLTQIEHSLQAAKPAQQQRFLARLPKMLLSLDTLSLLKNAESSFEFWNNPTDAVYDEL